MRSTLVLAAMAMAASPLAAVGATAPAVLVVPPGPGDLSGVKHLAQSDDFTVEVRRSGDAEYRRCFVYKSDNYWVHRARRPQQSASFAGFSFSGTAVDVRVTCSDAVNSVTIRPLGFGIPCAREGNTVTFTLAVPRKISVEVNDRNNPLFLFADSPDVPDTQATYYYGPGVHRIGKQKALKSNESVYIAGGAVVEGSFFLPPGSDHVSIRGRGILTMGEWPHPGNDGTKLEDCAIRSNGATHLTVEGITIANSSWVNICVRGSDYGTGAASHDNRYLNLKIVSWNGNTDGIWFDGDNNLVDDCFIFNNDDVVTTHGSNNCTIRNVVAWSGMWGRLFMHTDYASSSNLTFENINLIGKDGGPEVILVEATSGRPHTLSHFTFRNIRVEEHVKLNSFYEKMFLRVGRISWNAERPVPFSISVKDWLFEEITLDDKNPDEGNIHGAPGGRIDGIVFRNVRMAGAAVMSLEEANMDKNEYATDITFAP